MADRREIFAVCAGGFIGALARAVLSDRLPHAPGAWPWATFAANVVGAFVLGYAATRLGDRQRHRRLFVGTGVCGALTTFSTLQLEVLQMLDEHSYQLAGAYLGGSVALGLLAVGTGVHLARRIPVA